MAANMTLPNQQRLIRQGINKLKTDDALRALDFIFGYLGEYSQFCVCSINWDKYRHEFNNPYVRAYIDQAIKKANRDNDKRHSFLEQYAGYVKEEKKSFLLKHLRIQLVKVTEIQDMQKITLETVFADLGVDSLMGVEFANLIEMDFQLKISVNLFFEFPTMALLIDYLLKEINISLSSSGQPDFLPL